MKTETPNRIAIADIAELDTAVALHGSAKQTDSVGHLCFSIAVALSSYAIAA